MSDAYAVIGSGPSGANAALTLLERGKTVVLYDVGVEETGIPHPEKSFEDLKGALEDPVPYFLGEDLRGVLPPASGAVFDYPPARNFRVSPEGPLLKYGNNGFRPVLSHNRGGLGVAWGANAVPYDEDDIKGWPLSVSDLREGYALAQKRMRVTDALALNGHDAALWNRYQRKKTRLGRDFRIVMDRSRMAVDVDPSSPTRCTYCDRCLWGCGSGSIYDPRSTLAECGRYSHFTYRPHAYVTHFGTQNGRVRSVGYYDAREKTKKEDAADTVLLAAGALSSAGIFLRTLRSDPRAASVRKTKSLLDTQVVKMPYVFLSRIGRPGPDRDFQFNKLVLGYVNEAFSEFPAYVHAEVLSLTSLLYHPLIESLPFGSRLSRRLFAYLKPALGVVTFFAPDRPHGQNGISLEPDPASITGDRMVFTYENSAAKEALIGDATRAAQKAFWSLGCYLARRDILTAPPGSGIHYAGTIPMSVENDLACVAANGATYAYPNLYVVDGAAFPTLPSRSITLSLVANAIRVAKAA